MLSYWPFPIFLYWQRILPRTAESPGFYLWEWTLVHLSAILVPMAKKSTIPSFISEFQIVTNPKDNRVLEIRFDAGRNLHDDCKTCRGPSSRNDCSLIDLLGWLGWNVFAVVGSGRGAS